MITTERKKYNADLTALNKAINVYIRRIDKSSGAKIKTGDIDYSDFFENKMLIIKAIRNGLPYKLFDKIKVIHLFQKMIGQST